MQITRDDSELAQHSLNDNLISLRKYQHLKKLKAAVNAVIALLRWIPKSRDGSESQDVPGTEASGTEESKGRTSSQDVLLYWDYCNGYILIPIMQKSRCQPRSLKQRIVNSTVTLILTTLNPVTRLLLSLKR